MYGETNDVEEARKWQAFAKSKGFKDAFIVTFN